MLKQINNQEEMIAFIKSVEEDFGCQEDYEEWFGFELKYDEETGMLLETLDDYQGPFTNCPDESEYPVVISYINNHKKDRYGDLIVTVWDWISIQSN